MRNGVLLLIPVIGFVAGCDSGGEGASRQEAVQEEARVVSEAQAVEFGERAASTLTRELMGRVRTAMEAGGPAYAIEFCSERALPLTAAVADSLGVEIKRTSSRLRNPRNAPDAQEQAALEYFESELAAGNELPSHRLQQVDGAYHYYKPIVVADFCTACHGPLESLDPAVREALAERYPEDRATGYQAGDFRGIIHVSIPTSR